MFTLTSTSSFINAERSGIFYYISSLESFLVKHVGLTTVMFIGYFLGAHFEFFYKLDFLRKQQADKSSASTGYMSLTILSYIFINPAQASISLFSKRVKKLVKSGGSASQCFEFIKDLFIFIFLLTLYLFIVVYVVSMVFYGTPIGPFDTFTPGTATTLGTFVSSLAQKFLKIFYQPILGIASGIGRPIYVTLEKIAASAFRFFLKRPLSSSLINMGLDKGNVGFVIDSLSYLIAITILVGGVWDIFATGWNESNQYHREYEEEHGVAYEKGWFRVNTPSKNDDSFFQDLFDGAISKFLLTIFYSAEIIYINSFHKGVPYGQQLIGYSVSCHFLTDIYIGISHGLVPSLLSVAPGTNLFFAFWGIVWFPLILANLTLFWEIINILVWNQSPYLLDTELPTFLILAASTFRGFIGFFNSLSVVLEGTRYLSYLQILSGVTIQVYLFGYQPELNQIPTGIFIIQLLTVILGIIIFYIQSLK